MGVDQPQAIIGIVTISDRASAGLYEDKGGPAIEAYFSKILITPFRFEKRIIPDGFDSVRDTLIELVDQFSCDLIVTTGGTGLVPEILRLRRRALPVQENCLDLAN